MRNQDQFGDLYMPFDHLLFFGASLSSDFFAYAILRGVIRKEWEIYIWDHEDDSRTSWAYGLRRYLERFLRDTDDEESDS